MFFEAFALAIFLFYNFQVQVSKYVKKISSDLQTSWAVTYFVMRVCNKESKNIK